MCVYLKLCINTYSRQNDFDNNYICVIFSSAAMLALSRCSSRRWCVVADSETGNAHSFITSESSFSFSFFSFLFLNFLLSSYSSVLL